MTVALEKAQAAQTQLLPSGPRPVHRFTLEQYHQMIESGILGEHERVELIEGFIVEKMTHNPPHDSTIQLVQTELLKLLPAEWVLRIQSAISLTDSEPEPDLVVARGPIRRYSTSHPRPRDIGLVIEVADSSLVEDRMLMGRLYAQTRIPVYWIVNLVERQIEVYMLPRAGKSPIYRRRQDHPENTAVQVIIDGRSIGCVPVRDLLP